jgi:hypothetical protein
VFPLLFSEVHWTWFGPLFKARTEFSAATNWRPSVLNCAEVQNWMKKKSKIVAVSGGRSWDGETMVIWKIGVVFAWFSRSDCLLNSRGKIQRDRFDGAKRDYSQGLTPFHQPRAKLLLGRMPATIASPIPAAPQNAGMRVRWLGRRFPRQGRHSAVRRTSEIPQLFFICRRVHQQYQGMCR